MRSHGKSMKTSSSGLSVDNNQRREQIECRYDYYDRSAREAAIYNFGPTVADKESADERDDAASVIYPFV